MRFGHAIFMPVAGPGPATSGGGWAMTLNGQTIDVPAAAPDTNFTAGQCATLLVRPESIRVDTAPPKQPYFTGTVERLAYLGAQAEYDVRIGDYLVAAIRHDPRAEDLHGVGTTVYLGLAQENLYLLR